MLVVILCGLVVPLVCVEGKVITDQKEWEKCCPNCTWEWNEIKGNIKPICQCYNNTFYYATVYDTGNRISVFSQFMLTNTSVPRPDVEFAIEPQLINPNASKNMEQEEDLTPDEKKKLGLNQAHLMITELGVKHMIEVI